MVGIQAQNIPLEAKLAQLTTQMSLRQTAKSIDPNQPCIGQSFESILMPIVPTALFTAHGGRKYKKCMDGNDSNVHLIQFKVVA